MRSLSHWTPRLCLWLGVAGVVLFGTPALLFAQKTDVVILRNGDRMTGKIKKLERGKLKYNTDDMGDVYIKWDKIISLTTKNTLEVELQSGAKYYGSLQQAAEAGTMEVVTLSDTTVLNLASVVRMTLLEATFWDRLKGYLDLGFSFTQANEKRELTLGAELRLRTRTRYIKTDFSSYINSQEEVERASRSTLGVLFQRFLADKWLALADGRIQQNEELDLEYRALLGGGFGRYVIQTNALELTLAGGVQVNQEKFGSEETANNNVEGLLSVQFLAFRFDDPEVDVTITHIIYPSLSSSGRVRMEFSSRVRYELVKDFFFNVSLYDAFDNRPPADDVPKNDFGVTTSLSWSL